MNDLSLSDVIGKAKQSVLCVKLIPLMTLCSNLKHCCFATVRKISWFEICMV